MKPTLCRSCSAPIVWCLTAAGKRIPVDRVPVAGGNLKLTVEADGTTRAEAAGEPELFASFDEDDRRYVAHFTTCPEADEWRSR